MIKILKYKSQRIQIRPVKNSEFIEKREGISPYGIGGEDIGTVWLYIKKVIFFIKILIKDYVLLILPI